MGKSPSRRPDGAPRSVRIGTAAGVIAVHLVVAAVPAQATPHDPLHAENPVTWCGIHAARRELKEALSDCDYALAKRPNDPVALSNRATVHLLSGDPAAALRDLDVAVTHAPDDPNIHFNRGLALSELAQRSAAIAAYSKAIRLNPAFAPAWHNRGIEHERLGQLDRAAADFRRALEIEPHLPQPRAGLKRVQGRI